MNFFKKVWSFIKNHPIWTVVIFCTILCFIDTYNNKKVNGYGYIFLALFLLALISPYIRKLRRDKQTKKDNDYLAAKIAEEIKKD